MGRAFYKGDVNLPAFLTAQNLKPFIPNELYVTSSQIVPAAWVMRLAEPEYRCPPRHRYRAE